MWQTRLQRAGPGYMGTFGLQRSAPAGAGEIHHGPAGGWPGFGGLGVV